MITKNYLDKIDDNNNYSLVYETTNGKYAQMTVRGSMMKNSLYYLMKKYMSLGHALDFNEMKDVCSSYTVLWALMYTEKTAKFSGENDYAREIIKLIKKAQKHKQNAVNELRSHLAVYLLLKLMQRKDYELEFDTVHVIDFYRSDEEIENFKKTWRSQGITNRLGIKSWEEFYERAIKNGALKFEYVNSINDVIKNAA